MSKLETLAEKPQTTITEGNEVLNLISGDFESQLESCIETIRDYIKNNPGQDKTDDEKDELYSNAQKLWQVYASVQRATKYNFNLNRDQWKFLKDLILSRIEYDVNTVFFAIELTELFKTATKNLDYKNDTDIKQFSVNATEITYIYHLIANHKVKGLTKEAFTFMEVLRRIGDISKLINFFDNEGKVLSKDIEQWVVLFDVNVTLEATEQ